MRTDLVPEEAESIANSLAAWLKTKRKKHWKEASPWGDAPYRTTYYLKDGNVFEFYEAQGRPHLHSQLLNFANWLAANRKCAELSIVAPAEAPTTADLFNILKKNGVGLMLRDADGALVRSLPPRNPAFVVTPDPSLSFRDVRARVTNAVAKFNDGSRKDGFRDLCEIAENETERVLVKAADAGITNLTKPVIQSKDWSDKINALASSGILVSKGAPLIDAKLKDDLHSFRGARNSADHPARTRADEVRLLGQLCERMMMGTRLISELATIRIKIT